MKKSILLASVSICIALAPSFSEARGGNAIIRDVEEAFHLTREQASAIVREAGFGGGAAPKTRESLQKARDKLYELSMIATISHTVQSNGGSLVGGRAPSTRVGFQVPTMPSVSMDVLNRVSDRARAAGLTPNRTDMMSYAQMRAAGAGWGLTHVENALRAMERPIPLAVRPTAAPGVAPVGVASDPALGLGEWPVFSMARTSSAARARPAGTAVDLEDEEGVGATRPETSRLYPATMDESAASAETESVARLRSLDQLRTGIDGLALPPSVSGDLARAFTSPENNIELLTRTSPARGLQANMEIVGRDADGTHRDPLLPHDPLSGYASFSTAADGVLLIERLRPFLEVYDIRRDADETVARIGAEAQRAAYIEGSSDSKRGIFVLLTGLLQGSYSEQFGDESNPIDEICLKVFRCGVGNAVGIWEQNRDLALPRVVGDVGAIRKTRQALRGVIEYWEGKVQEAQDAASFKFYGERLRESTISSIVDIEDDARKLAFLRTFLDGVDVRSISDVVLRGLIAGIENEGGFNLDYTANYKIFLERVEASTLSVSPAQRRELGVRKRRAEVEAYEAQYTQFTTFLTNMHYEACTHGRQESLRTLFNTFAGGRMIEAPAESGRSAEAARRWASVISSRFRGNLIDTLPGIGGARHTEHLKAAYRTVLTRYFSDQQLEDSVQDGFAYNHGFTRGFNMPGSVHVGSFPDTVPGMGVQTTASGVPWDASSHGLFAIRAMRMLRARYTGSTLLDHIYQQMEALNASEGVSDAELRMNMVQREYISSTLNRFVAEPSDRGDYTSNPENFVNFVLHDGTSLRLPTQGIFSTGLSMEPEGYEEIAPERSLEIMALAAPEGLTGYELNLWHASNDPSWIGDPTKHICLMGFHESTTRYTRNGAALLLLHTGHLKLNIERGEGPDPMVLVDPIALMRAHMQPFGAAGRHQYRIMGTTAMVPYQYQTPGFVHVTHQYDGTISGETLPSSLRESRFSSESVSSLRRDFSYNEGDIPTTTARRRWDAANSYGWVQSLFERTPITGSGGGRDPIVLSLIGAEASPQQLTANGVRMVSALLGLHMGSAQAALTEIMGSGSRALPSPRSEGVEILDVEPETPEVPVDSFLAVYNSLQACSRLTNENRDFILGSLRWGHLDVDGGDRPEDNGHTTRVLYYLQAAIDRINEGSSTVAGDAVMGVMMQAVLSAGLNDEEGE